MKQKAIGRFGLGLIAGAALAVVTGCASMVGWGPPPPATAAPLSAQHGASPFGHTTGMRLMSQQGAVKVPPWVRVQDCAIVAISSPSRYACPDGQVYTSFDLYRARAGS